VVLLKYRHAIGAPWFNKAAMQQKVAKQSKGPAKGAKGAKGAKVRPRCRVSM